jgi:hypothetical protein
VARSGVPTAVVDVDDHRAPERLEHLPRVAHEVLAEPAGQDRSRPDSTRDVSESLDADLIGLELELRDEARFGRTRRRIIRKRGG